MDWKNRLYFGDNLDILRREVPDASVDLIYLDPPFNSNATYNVLFKEKSGEESAAQIMAFEDTWQWGLESEAVYKEIVTSGPRNLANLVQALLPFLGRNDMMAYLVMMAIRLVELHRVLKPTGSIYLHCDPTASHYLKLVMDAAFGPENYRNEITWKRRVGMSSAVHESNRFGICTDILLFYAKTEQAPFRPQYNKGTFEYEEYIRKRFTVVDAEGRRFQATSLVNPAYRPNLIYTYRGYKPPKNGWMITKEKMEQWDREGRLYFPRNKSGRIRRKSFADELKGMPVQNLWTDIPEINSQAQERLGYPTQKPEALLERILKAGCDEGDLVLDPFCGCGTAVAVAERLKRRWIGIDITYLAINLVQRRLRDAFRNDLCPYEVVGAPTDLASAEALKEISPHQFEWWAVDLANARPAKDRKKGADTGVDGYINFFDDKGGKAKQVIVQVKSGYVGVNHVRDLIGVLEREKAAIGALITLREPTKPMLTEAAAAGFYESKDFPGRYPRLQILTIAELLAGKKIQYPDHRVETFAKAERKTKQQQGEMF